MTIETKTITQSDLAQFYGTEHYYLHQTFPGAPNAILLTDGVKYLAENVECYWLLDLICSYLHKIPNDEYMFFVDIEKKEHNTGTITIHDGDKGDGKVYFAEQELEYMDWPETLPKQRIYFGLSGSKQAKWTACLPSEY